MLSLWIELPWVNFQRKSLIPPPPPPPPCPHFPQTPGPTSSSNTPILNQMSQINKEFLSNRMFAWSCQGVHESRHNKDISKKMEAAQLLGFWELI